MGKMYVIDYIVSSKTYILFGGGDRASWFVGRVVRGSWFVRGSGVGGGAARLFRHPGRGWGRIFVETF